MNPFEPARALQGAPGFMLVDPNTDMHVYTPSWYDPMYFLPVGSPQPGMSSTDDDNWYHHVPDLVRAVGSRRRISFLNAPSDMQTSDVEPTPYDLLRDTAWAMSADTHPHWQRLFIRKGYRRPALSNPNWALLMQGMLYGYPNMPYGQAPIRHAVMALSPQLAMSVQTMRAGPLLRALLLQCLRRQQRLRADADDLAGIQAQRHGQAVLPRRPPGGDADDEPDQLPGR